MNATHCESDAKVTHALPPPRDYVKLDHIPIIMLRDRIERGPYRYGPSTNFPRHEDLEFIIRLVRVDGIARQSVHRLKFDHKPRPNVTSQARSCAILAATTYRRKYSKARCVQNRRFTALRSSCSTVSPSPVLPPSSIAWQPTDGRKPASTPAKTQPLPEFLFDHTHTLRSRQHDRRKAACD